MIEKKNVGSEFLKALWLKKKPNSWAQAAGGFWLVSALPAAVEQGGPRPVAISQGRQLVLGSGIKSPRP